LEAWADKACAPVYDPRDVPIGDKDGITLGMGMTEKQGGSDVRRNGTVAAPLQADGEYALVGHKWFFSAPMSDGWLVLAQAPGGLSCFLMPRRLPDGGKNAFRLMRLKDKLGDWANASGEVEFCNAWALRVGPEGRGVATIIEMVMLTRLDCMLGAAAQMRMALAQAIHHARHRHAFGRVLAEQPLMRNVLADLALEAEAALALAMRVARAVDAAPHDPRQAAFARWPRPPANTGCASARRPSSTKRRNASAGPATWRNRSCRACIGRRRSIRYGKAAATSSAWTCCAR
jgi:putative acyl-CoA dehydrogenase